MENYFALAKVVAFQQVTGQGPEQFPGAPTSTLGYGISELSDQADVTRRNCWLMTGGLITPADVRNTANTIYLGYMGVPHDARTNYTLRPDATIYRPEFLNEMRGVQQHLDFADPGKTRWVESHLRSFTREKPTLTQDPWPPGPDLPSGQQPRQIDTGTIGIARPMQDGPLPVGEIHVDVTGGVYSEIWVVSEDYQLHMPPGTGAQPAVNALQPSTLFAGGEPTSQQDFLDRAYQAYGGNCSVFLVRASVSAVIPPT